MQNLRSHPRRADSKSEFNRTPRGFSGILEPEKPTYGFYSRLSVDVLSIRNAIRASSYREVSIARQPCFLTCVNSLNPHKDPER